jgi:hypothetical protein
VFAECGIKYRLQHLQQCLLDQAIRHRRVSGSLPDAPDWAGTSLSAVVPVWPATRRPDAARSG